MGFMLIEISQMQRLMVFLGHPVYALGVVLFTILLFSGIGSATVGARAPRPGAVAARVVALLATLVAAGAADARGHRLGAVGRRPTCAFWCPCCCLRRRRSAWG